MNKTKGKAGHPRRGSVIGGKRLTDWEKIKVSEQLKADKERWEILFSTNKWTPRP